MIDWKLSKENKEDIRSLFDFPTKTVASLGALYNDVTQQGFIEKNEIKNVMIINYNYKSNIRIEF